MAREKKLESPVTLFAAAETKQHEALRAIAFRERRSLADVVREALSDLIARRAEQTAAPRRAVRG